MTVAWFLCGVFGALTGIFVWLLLTERRLSIRALADQSARYEGQIEHLRREKDILLNTALNAQGVQVLEPIQTGSPRHAEVVVETLRQRVNKRLGELAERDRQEAMDRDARVAAEIEERRREARDRMLQILEAEEARKARSA